MNPALTPQGSAVATDAQHREVTRAYRLHYEHLCAYAATIVDGEDAVDVVHDAFAKYYRRLHATGSPPRATAARTLLFGMVHDCAKDLERRNMARGRALQLVSGARAAVRRWTTTSRRVDDDEITRTIARAVEGLRPSWQQVHVLIRQQGLDAREAAQVLGIKEATVRAHLVRATEALQVSLTRAGLSPANGLQRRART